MLLQSCQLLQIVTIDHLQQLSESSFTNAALCLSLVSRCLNSFSKEYPMCSLYIYIMSPKYKLPGFSFHSGCFIVTVNSITTQTICLPKVPFVYDKKRHL